MGGTLVASKAAARAVPAGGTNLVAAAATGSTHGGRHCNWICQLVVGSRVLVAFDADEPGDRAARADVIGRVVEAVSTAVGAPASVLDHRRDA